MLNPTGGQDPNDGTPSQESVLASLRATLQGTVTVVNRTELDFEAYSPVMYPSPQFAVRDEPVGI